MQPNIVAKSPMIAVKKPMRIKAEKNASHPPQRDVGGIRANSICWGRGQA